MAVRPSWIAQAGINDSVAVENNKNKLKDSLSYLAGLGASTDAYTYLTNIVLRPSIISGIEAGLQSRGEVLAIASLRNAMTQRDLQNASEKSMWLSVSRSLATFFEGFVIAVVPFVPIIMFIGNTIGIIIKYFQVLLWVQLWSPVMTICNLYITKATAQAVQNALQGTNIGSFNSIETVEETVQHWIGVGGMLAGLTPVLALFIISGSIYTFNSLVSRISGADHFNEKGIAPDLMQQAPLINSSVGGAITASDGGGAITVGTNNMYKKYGERDVFQRVAQSQHAVAIEKAKNYNDSFNQGWNKLKQDGKTKSVIDQFSSSLQSSNSAAYRDMLSQADSLLQSVGITESIGEQEYLDLKKQIAWKASTGALSLNFEDSTSLGERTQQDLNKAYKNNRDKMVQISRMSENGKSLQDVANDAITTSLSSSDSDIYGKSLAKQISNNYTESKKASDSYSDTEANLQSMSISRERSSNELATMIDDGKFKRWAENSRGWVSDKLAEMSRDGKKCDTLTAQKARMLEYFMDHPNDEHANEFWSMVGNETGIRPLSHDGEKNSSFNEIEIKENVGGEDLKEEVENKIKHDGRKVQEALDENMIRNCHKIN